MNDKKMSGLICLIITLVVIGCGKQATTEAEKIDSAELKKVALLEAEFLAGMDSIKLQAELDSIKAAMALWTVGTFVDNFGDPTKDKFLTSKVEGTFSNSATTMSELYVEVLLTKKNGAIFLHEYALTRPAVKPISSMQIQMKNEAGKTQIVNSSGEWSQDGGLKIPNHIGDFYIGNYDKFRKFLLSSNGEIKVVIFDDYSSSYSFRINTKGLKDAYNSL